MSQADDQDKQRRITYDWEGSTPPPAADSLLVSFRLNNTPGTVYHVVAARQVRSAQHPQRYALLVVRAPDLLAEVVITPDQLLIRGKRAYPLYWYSRTPKPRP